MAFTKTTTTKLIMLTDFRRGVRFVRGVFANILEPGNYRINTVKETVTLVDMRPQPLIFESYRYRDALNNQSVISIGTELMVADPYLAATTLKNYINDAAPIVQDVFQAMVVRLVADASTEGRKAIASEITRAVNAALGKFGLYITPVEVTELYSKRGQDSLDVKGGITQ
jgi:regulator of protease activity HflC (stomatin/prohibitin superfamily)